jgi:hypothetical protein
VVSKDKGSATIFNAGEKDYEDNNDDVAFEDDNVVELWINCHFEVHALLVPFELMKIAVAQALLDNDASIDEPNPSDDKDEKEEEERVPMEAVCRE